LADAKRSAEVAAHVNFVMFPNQEYKRKIRD
jgi:hypothetical protein